MVRPVAHTFSFRIKHSYDTTKIGITVPVELTGGSNIVQVDAKLDTGASFCIFERAYGEMLGLDVEGGTQTLVSTANSTFQAFGHWLTMTALGFQFEVMVYFASDESIRRSVLGRLGFIDQLRLCLIEHDGELYISKYDDE
jgi:predicted aspartyl protease